MKKLLGKLTIATLFAIGLTFTSCHDPIFETILNEVPLETNGITGNITSLIKKGTTIYLSNGNVYKRAADVQGNEKWERLISDTDSKNWFSGFEANRISYIAYGDELYGIATLWSTTSDGVNVDTNGRTLCYFNGTKWVAVTGVPSGVTPKLIFGDEENSKAYVRFSDNKVYSLGSGSVGADTGKTGVSSCANGKFFSGTCARYVDSKIYYLSASDNYLHRCDSDGSNEKIISLAVGELISFDITSDTIIFGTSAGIAHVKRSAAEAAFDNSSSSSAASVSNFTFSNNAKTIFTTSYECNPVLVANRAEKEDDTIIFAGLCYKGEPGSGKGIYNNMGLYAYYPDRGTWNRDGTADAESEGN